MLNPQMAEYTNTQNVIKLLKEPEPGSLHMNNIKRTKHSHG